MVGRSMQAEKRRAARNLPTAMSVNETGMVNRISYEPTLISSEKRRMVTAGIIKENIMGSMEKKFLISAVSKRKKVEKKNHPVTTRKSEITMYAIGEIK